MSDWAALWWQNPKYSFCPRKHIIRRNLLPVLFKTRRECRKWIQQEYGYIKTRKDLRQYPHGWRLPKAVKVKIEVE